MGHVISDDTVVEMISYLSGLKKSDVKSGSNLKELLKKTITDLARKLYLRNELYLKKADIKYDSVEHILNKNGIFRFKSNAIIYKTLKEIGGTVYFDDTNDKSSSSEVNKSDDSSSEADKSKEFKDANNRRVIATIADNLTESDWDVTFRAGSKDRLSLLRLCRMYHRQELISDVKTKNHAEAVKVAWERECDLFEEVIRKHTVDKFKGNDINVSDTNKIVSINSKEKPYALSLETDIIVKSPNKLIIIDCKVYKNIKSWSHGKPKYRSNGNRFQVNSYIGSALQKEEYKRDLAEGILVHLVPTDADEDTMKMHQANLTIEDERPIELWVIQDKGLNSIFKEYDELLRTKLEAEQDEDKAEIS